jgi:hypothetical protein
MPPPHPTPLYRILHVNNLAGIVAQGGIWCENQRAQRGVAYQNIAHQNIQQRRHDTPVPCGPGGTIHDYVPWYFAPRSPMLYANHKGCVANNPDGQAVIIYLCTSIEAVVKAGLPFVFTDGHAIMFNSHFHANLGQLDQIDWPLMQSKYWHAIDSDLDRPRRRQAEFLVHGFAPWTLVEEIDVFDQTRLAAVQTCLQDATHRPVVRRNTSWFF